mmetsp:Transcript_26321/g.54833  ORF Transcript_26321/g.54833 Transcript_26321/m.54833 type:complete len:421 (-) Transcript_26321:17-1279(-)
MAIQYVFPALAGTNWAHLSTVICMPFAALLFMNNVLPILLLSRKNTGNDGTMLAFRKKSAISSYTKFQINLKAQVDMEKAMEDIKNSCAEMLTRDSLLNIDPATKAYVRRSLSQIVHGYAPPSSGGGRVDPPFSSVAFSAVDTDVPVHVFISTDSHSVFFFIDHCIADGLTMYNEVVAPIIGNPRFRLAKRPLYFPVITEFHQIYVIARMLYVYLANVNSGGLARTPKADQFPTFHTLPLAPIKKMKNELKVPVAAIIMSVLVKHLGRSLKNDRGDFKICLSYAFENESSFNNYSFIIIDTRSDLPISSMAKYIHKQLFNRRHEINTMYHLLQMPSGSSKLTSTIQQTICDAYIAMTMVPEGDSSRSELNVMRSMKNEHYSISTGLNMTAVSIGEEVHISSKCGLRDIDRGEFEMEMVLE